MLKLSLIIFFNILFLPIYICALILCFIFTFIPLYPVISTNKNLRYRLNLIGFKNRIFMTKVFMNYMLYLIEMIFFDSIRLSIATCPKNFNLVDFLTKTKDFYSDKSKKDGLNTNCKDCKNIQKNNYRQKLKEEEKDLENNNEKEDIKEDDEFDKNIFDENFADKYSKYDLCKIADNNNLKFTKNHTRAELIHIIKENNTLDPLEKLTKNKLMKLATNKKIKTTHHYTKIQIIDLINSLK